jgi:hypothetical protein
MEAVVPIEAQLPIVFSIYQPAKNSDDVFAFCFQRSHAKCRFWLFATAVGAVFYLINFIVASVSEGEASLSSIGLYVLSLFFDIYCMLVVFSFLDELTSDPTAVGYNA